MAHLLVRHHNEQFGIVMDKCSPGWRQLRQMLNAAPLAHTDWIYGIPSEQAAIAVYATRFIRASHGRFFGCTLCQTFD
jgi:hypothetical protein